MVLDFFLKKEYVDMSIENKVYFSQVNEENKSTETENNVDNSKNCQCIAKNIHCLTIVGQIEGHIMLPAQNKTTKYEHVIPQLVAIEEDINIKGLLLVLNTVGGDVEAGLAIAEMIASMSKPTVSLVLGGGHSIGVPLAVSTNYSYIASSATMTIHPLRLNGMIIGVPQTYEYFDKMQDRVVDFVTKNSRITRQKFRELMLKTGELANDVGTVLFGEEAVKHGIIDSLGGLSQSLYKLYDLIDKNNLSEDNKAYNLN